MALHFLVEHFSFLGFDGQYWMLIVLAIIAVTLGAINVFGGFAVTERMLQMFRRKESK